jgi:amidase
VGEGPYRGAIELVAALDAGEVSAVELAEAAIARIERHDPVLNAVCVRDFDRALQAAKQADAVRAGGGRAPLLGVPMTVKESFHVEGLPITWGTPARVVSDTDAVAVARVRAAGAVVLGKTNVPPNLGDLQSYNDVYGTSRNPWDPERTPGGSSGGSAAALAAGYGALSIGSDIGGSLRNPAHFCGVYAHKPTLGLLPMRGHTPPGVPVVPSSSDLAVIGPMARTATDLSLLFDVLAEPDELDLGGGYRLALPEARHAELAGHRVLLLDSVAGVAVAASVRAAVDDFAGRLAAAGATVIRASDRLPDLVEASGLYRRLLMAALSAGMPPQIHEQAVIDAAALDPDDHTPGADQVRGLAMSHRDWVLADGRRRWFREQWRALFADVDIVLCPVTATPAFPHDHRPMGERRLDVDGVEHGYFDQLALAGVATLPGLPVTVLPIGRSPEGLPIGVQAIGPMYGDRTTLRFAELAEREFGGFRPPPLD